MRLILFALCLLSLKAVYSQKLFIHADSSYYSFEKHFLISGKSIQDTLLIDSIFIQRGAEGFSRKNSTIPFIVENGRIIYPVLTPYEQFNESQSSYNKLKIVSSRPRYFREFRDPPPRDFSYTKLLEPYLNYDTNLPIYVGFGSDSLGSLIFLTIQDTSLQIFTKNNCYINANSAFDVKRLTTNFPKDLSNTNLKTTFFHIWEDSSGILALFEGLYVLRLTDSGFKVINKYDTPHSVIRSWSSPFHVDHELVRTP